MIIEQIIQVLKFVALVLAVAFLCYSLVVLFITEHNPANKMVQDHYTTDPMLTEKEIEILYLLQNKVINTAYTPIVEDLFQNFSIRQYRKLLCEWKEAASQQPVRMKRILGDLYEPLIAL